MNKKIQNKKLLYTLLFIIILAISVALGTIIGIATKKNDIPTVNVSEKSDSDKKIDKHNDETNEDIADRNPEEKYYTEEYKNYMNLSDEEKKNVGSIPRKEIVEYDELDNIISKENKIIEDKTENKQEENQSEDKQDKNSDSKQNSNNENETNDKQEENKTDDKQNETIPNKFDLRDVIDVKVENQQSFGLCWLFSSMKAFETNIALTQGKNYDFSEIHVDYMMSKLFSNKKRDIHQAGFFDYFIDYAIAFGGFVLEDDLEYRDYTEEEYVAFPNMAKVDETIYDAVYFPTYDPNKMDWTEEQFKKYQDALKKHIMNFGALQISAVTPDSIESNGYYYYDSDDALKVVDSLRLYHDMAIIGWDDTYSKENFKSPSGKVPKNDGAYLVLNSWSEYWGDRGCFWISYEDFSVHQSICGVISTDSKDLIDLDALNNKAISDYIEEKYKDEIKYIGNKKYINKLVLNTEYEVDLSNRNMTSLEGLEIFPHIYQLNLSNNNIKDISKIAEFTEIWNLNLSNNPEITDISVIKDMYNLEILDLSENKNINNLSIIKDLKLRELYLRDCNIKNIGQILPDSVYDIDLSKNKEIEDYYSLNSSTTVILQDCDIVDASILNQLWKVYGLDLSYNKGISNINQLPSQIGYLALNNCDISDLSEINQLNNISGLELRDNNLGDVTSLKHISTLDLSGNKNVYGDFTGGNVQTLKIIDCEKNNDFDFFGLTTINDLYIKGNNFSISDALEKVTCKFRISGDEYNYSNLADLTGELFRLDETDIHYKIKVPKGNVKIELKKMFDSSFTYKDIICEQGKINRTFGYIELNVQENGQIILTDAYDFNNRIGSKCRMVIDYEIEENINPVSIKVTKVPDKIKFKANENIITSGLEVSEVYGNGLYKKTNNYNVVIPNKDELAYGYNKITVKQNNLTTTYTIEYGIDEIVYLDINSHLIYEEMSNLIKEKCPDALIWENAEDLAIRFNKSAIGTVQNEFRLKSQFIQMIKGLAPLDLTEINIDVVTKINQSDLEKLHQTFPNLKVLHLRDKTANGEFGENAIEGEQNYFEIIYD